MKLALISAGCKGNNMEGVFPALESRPPHICTAPQAVFASSLVKFSSVGV